jgi:hypothetical protein
MLTLSRNKFVLTTVTLLITHCLCLGQIKDTPISIELEAESFVSQTKDEIRKWVVQNDENASGKKYMKLLPDTRITHDDSLKVGINFSNNPGKMSIISYEVDIPQKGRYYVWARALSTGTEDNSVHVGFNNIWSETGARMQWCDGKNVWFYESKQRTETNHCGEPHLIYLNFETFGKHIVQFSLREDGFAMDKFILTTDKNFKPENNK